MQRRKRCKSHLLWVRKIPWSRTENGNPLQYSCLENKMYRGAWWAIVHGVTKSWTRLSSHTHTHTETLICCKLTFLENAVFPFPSKQLPCIYMCMPGQKWYWWKERDCFGHFLWSLLRENKIQLCASLCRMLGGSPWQNLQGNFLGKLWPWKNSVL